MFHRTLARGCQAHSLAASIGTWPSTACGPLLHVHLAQGEQFKVKLFELLEGLHGLVKRIHSLLVNDEVHRLVEQGLNVGHRLDQVVAELDALLHHGFSRDCDARVGHQLMALAFHLKGESGGCVE